MTPSPADIASVCTLPQLLAYRAARTPNSEAYRAFDTTSQAWTSLTWAETAQRVGTWAQALAAMLTAPKQVVQLTATHGAQYHDAPMNPQYRNEVIFDWLDRTLQP